MSWTIVQCKETHFSESVILFFKITTEDQTDHLTFKFNICFVINELNLSIVKMSSSFFIVFNLITVVCCFENKLTLACRLHNSFFSSWISFLSLPLLCFWNSSSSRSILFFSALLSLNKGSERANYDKLNALRKKRVSLFDFN